MQDCNYRPDGTGVVMGDRKPVPDKGTGTGLTGYDPQLDSTSIDLDATNRLGGISGTGSNRPEQNHADDPSVRKHTAVGGE